ncbi:aminodeoxychorismate/anthranilate synthase component II [Gammaproteobacteria bacterium]|nr:aminodeoxychorismate/anthranilate synthase component II [Gammaproteobacteria bacterium]
MILMIDNYDSFTYNLVQYLGELGEDVRVVRNDEIKTSDISKIAPTHIVISPGPCSPNEAGISIDTIIKFSKVIPILGVCLGHQSLGQAFGGKITHARQVMHGKTSLIHHNKKDLFESLPSPYTATRYHSLIIDQKSLPECFKITAWTKLPNGEIDEIMGIRHLDLPLFGIQFHPESILTEHGHLLLKNFLKR